MQHGFVFFKNFTKEFNKVLLIYEPLHVLQFSLLLNLPSIEHVIEH